MIPELGHLALIIAMGMSLLAVAIPLIGAQRGYENWMHMARPLTWAYSLFLTLSFGALALAFVQDDFSVAYIAKNSNSLLPVQYKISAVWGSHEGSLLLWVLLLSFWAVAVSIFSKRLPLDVLARALAVMALIGLGFELFLLLTSNPFLRILPNSPLDGGDLNPLLQDFGLIVHPPMLYMGYVGFAVSFAFAIAALMTGRLDAAWARWSRPWTTLAWAFLSLGIALGSWWAYYELGWGGWWFWDPVENASFMPWLVGTALIHSLAVTEKRGAFKSWTLLLAIFAFSLSLLGTFLVRSGVLNSVHAFASDPGRGLFILALLTICIGGSLLLYAIKAPSVVTKVSFSWLSRESFLLMNNLLLVIVASMVLLGTLFPLIADFFFATKISVGPPYFNLFFVPMMSLLVILMNVGVVARWKKTSANVFVQSLWPAMAIAIIMCIAFPLVYGRELNYHVIWGVALCSWLIAGTLLDLWRKAQHSAGLVQGFKRIKPSYYGMVLGHLGVAVTAMGIAVVSNYTLEKDVRMVPGDSISLVNYEFKFDGVEKRQGPNYIADHGTIEVYDGTELYTVLHPQKRNYPVARNVMTEADIQPGLFRDLYVALGEPLENGAWAVRVHYKPYVRWLWLGAILMALGGLLAVSDRRYRLAVKGEAQ
ncbi:MAG: heme lyase CcmF/NrfE family subunit [Oceanospirillaceae bacterium]|nr:heme lyase CcmF/NrfE family subunit [Oceanospirillaceae bacterium]